MVVLRCAPGARRVVVVPIALTPDWTQELQRCKISKESAPLLVTCYAEELQLFLAKKWLSNVTRISTVLGDEQLLQLDDPKLLALMIPQTGYWVATDSSTSAIAVVRREFLTPDLELLSQGKLLALPNEPLLSDDDVQEDRRQR